MFPCSVTSEMTDVEVTKLYIYMYLLVPYQFALLCNYNYTKEIISQV